MSSYSIFQTILFYLLTYIVGGWCLLVQIFTRRKTLQGIPLQTGKVAIVTGGAAGIGFYVSKGLVARNVQVFIGGKCAETGQKAIKEIKMDFPNAQVEFIQLDLESIKSVADFVDDFLFRNLPLHILINNAGVMFTPLEYTGDGYEKQIQVNYLSHFYLTQLLLNKLVQSGSAESWTRVVNVSSYMHYIGCPSIDSLDVRQENWFKYSSHKAYADSKLLIIAAANMLHRRLREDNACVSVCSLHPGIVQSNLWNHVTPIHRLPVGLVGKFTFMSTEQGANNTLYAALAPEVEGQSGYYYDNMERVKSSALSYDENFQNSLWTKSTLMIENAGRTQ